MTVQAAQKKFYRLLAIPVLEAQGLGHLDLVFEIELVTPSTADVVEPVSYRQNE
jgi:hypothetical protein